jgi:uncharacterized repeat protein (TIGR01451 family)
VPPGVEEIVNQARLTSQRGFSVTQTHRSDLHAQAELVVDKTDGITTALAGSPLTYTITLRNTGNQGAASVVLTDTLPQYTTYVPGSASDGGNYDPIARQIVWPLANYLPGGQMVTRSYQVLVEDSIPLDVLYLTNTVTVDDDGANGDTSDGNLATDVNTVDRHPALHIVKRGPDTAEVGERIDYTLYVATVSYTPTNLSAARVGDGSPVRNIQVSDPIAQPVIYVRGDEDDDRLLELGETWVYVASYVVTSADRGELVNTATVQGTDINGDHMTATGTHTTHVPGRTLFLPIVLRAP